MSRRSVGRIFEQGASHLLVIADYLQVYLKVPNSWLPNGF
jgi:hypothetical protein